MLGRTQRMWQPHTAHHGWSCACASWVSLSTVLAHAFYFLLFFSFWSFFLLPCLASFSKVWECCHLLIFGVLFFFGFTCGVGSVPSFSALSDSTWYGALP
jgi:hypothetical protein